MSPETKNCHETLLWSEESVFQRQSKCSACVHGFLGEDLVSDRVQRVPRIQTPYNFQHTTPAVWFPVPLLKRLRSQLQMLLQRLKSVLNRYKGFMLIRRSTWTSSHGGKEPGKIEELSICLDRILKSTKPSVIKGS